MHAACALCQVVHNWPVEWLQRYGRLCRKCSMRADGKKQIEAHKLAEEHRAYVARQGRAF